LADGWAEAVGGPNDDETRGEGDGGEKGGVAANARSCDAAKAGAVGNVVSPGLVMRRPLLLRRLTERRRRPHLGRICIGAE